MRNDGGENKKSENSFILAVFRFLFLYGFTGIFFEPHRCAENISENLCDLTVDILKQMCYNIITRKPVLLRQRLPLRPLHKSLRLFFRRIRG